MYVKLREHICIADGRYPPSYFCYADYAFYTEEEKERLIRDGLRIADDFIKAPQLPYEEVMRAYLLSRSEADLARHVGEEDFYRQFHHHVEEHANGEYLDFRDFCEKKYLSMLEEWCVENRITYTLKDAEKR